MSNLTQILDRIESYKRDMIEFQRELTVKPAISPKSNGDGEYRKMLLIKDRVRELGLEILEYNAICEGAVNSIRPNISAVLKGEDQTKTLWIMTHLDVVPPGELSLWDTDPYELKIDGDKLYGRGTEDNQQDLVASYFMIKAFLDEQIVPPINIGMLIVSDEETGSEFGTRFLLENFDIFKKDDLLLVPDSGNSKGDMIEVAEKTMLWIKVTTTGKQCHAGSPNKGNNAYRAASHLITRLDKLYDKFSLTDDMFSPNKSTFEPTKKESNVENINTIPGEDIFYLDFRILPEVNYKDVLGEFNKIKKTVEKDFGVNIDSEQIIEDIAAPATPSDSAIVKGLTKAIKHILNVDAKVMGIGGGTVASHFRKRGLNVAVWSKIEHTAHQPNEYCLLSNMVYDAKVFSGIPYFV